MFDKKEYMKKYNQEHKEHKKQWQKNNKEHLKKYMKQYRKDNSENIKLWRKNNPEKTKAIQDKYYKNNLGKMREYRKIHQAKIKGYNKNYYKDNHETIIAYQSNKQKTDIKCNLNHKMRTAIRIALKGNKSGRRWEDLVGYTLNELIGRLKQTMPRGYTWDDFLNGKLHLDHKIPISAHNFMKPEHIDFRRCWALSNLQLLPARENISKSNELTRPFQPALQI